MPGNSNLLSTREQRYQAALASYLEAVDAGQSPDRQQFLVRYPAVAAELQAFFDNEDGLNRLAAPLRQPPSGDSLPAGDQQQTGLVYLHPAAAIRHKVAVGSVFAGSYRIFAVKAGGMGRVYLADDLEARQRDILLKVAIKSVVDFDEWQEARWVRGVPVEEAHYQTLLTRFRREALAWVRLGKHDNVILAMMVIDVGAKPYLVMEYADSGDLQTWIKERRLTVPLAVNFAIQFCEGMKHAVKVAGLVHRDIKPANALIQDNQRLKIADFGLAKVFDPVAEDARLDGSATADSSLSLAGGGTLPYMAPEQFESLARADTRSDIFSFGAMLHEMLTAQPLFKARDAYDQFTLRRQPILPAHKVNPQVPHELSAIIQRCVAYDSRERYQTFEELAAALGLVNERIDGPLPMPSDRQRLPVEVHAVGETYSLIALGQYEEAIKRADQGLSHCSRSADLWLNKGNALCKMKRFQEGRDCLERVIALRPRDALAWANLSWAKLELNQTNAALDAAARAIQLDRTLFDAWFSRGHCLLALGQVELAADAYLRSTELRAHEWTAHLNYGKCLLRLRRKGDALAALQQAVEINPHAVDAWSHLAICLSDMDCGEEALHAIDRSLECDGSNSAAWTVRGLLIWQWKNDAGPARACLQKALELDPGNEKARLYLARIKE